MTKTIDPTLQARLREVIEVQTVNDPESWSAKICKTCGLPFNEGSHCAVTGFGSFHYACLPHNWAVEEILRLREELHTALSQSYAARRLIIDLAELASGIDLPPDDEEC